MTACTPIEVPVTGLHPSSEPAPWRFPPRGIAVRLFLTCWLIYVLHGASNTVREIYLALAIGDHFSFRVDEYANIHPDLFPKAGYGWHIGANPGASMLGAIPYAVLRPVIDWVVQGVNRSRVNGGLTEPPTYNSPWPMAQEFYKEAWHRGFDIKFGLAAFVMQSLCMAVVSALGAVVMFCFLRRLFDSDRAALWLALLYAFGTPVFFRTGYLNQNLLLGHAALTGFFVLWDAPHGDTWSLRSRYLLGGLAAGAAVLLDYSGLVALLGLFAYGLLKGLPAASFRDMCRRTLWFALGALGPIALLWWYQWRSFGHPFFPGQHWMPRVEWIDRGYQGFQWPQLDLLLALAFDYRFGLFVSCPLLLLGLAAPLLHGRRLPPRELALMLGLFLGFWVFFSGVNYTRLQFNTGIRYLTPTLPFLFVPAATTLLRLPRLAAYLIVVFSVAESWCLAMYRDVERGLGVLDPILQVFLGGFKLPLLTVLSRMDSFRQYFAHGPSPLPLFGLTAALLYAIWGPSSQSLLERRRHG